MLAACLSVLASSQHKSRPSSSVRSTNSHSLLPTLDLRSVKVAERTKCAVHLGFVAAWEHSSCAGVRRACAQAHVACYVAILAEGAASLLMRTAPSCPVRAETIAAVGVRTSAKAQPSRPQVKPPLARGE
eukprot:scaffold163508_cov27-Tisochrysis_lutea.AAC.7